MTHKPSYGIKRQKTTSWIIVCFWPIRQLYGAHNKKYHKQCASGGGLNALFQWVTMFWGVASVKNKMWHDATSVRQECDMWRARCDKGATYIIFRAKSGSEAFKMRFWATFIIWQTCELWAFYERFYERLKRVRIVNFIVKMGFTHEFTLELPLNDKKQIVLFTLELPLDFVIFTPPYFVGICI